MTENAPQDLKWQRDSEDITAIILETVAAAAQSQGRQVEPVDHAAGISILLSASWSLAKLAHHDRAQAVEMFVDLLRRSADGIEAMEGGDKGDGGQ